MDKAADRSLDREADQCDRPPRLDEIRGGPPTGGEHGDGIGIALGPEESRSGIVGVDYDNCIDNLGTIDQPVQAIVDTLDSYTEYTPSGRGMQHLALGGKARAQVTQERQLVVQPLANGVVSVPTAGQSLQLPRFANHELVWVIGYGRPTRPGDGNASRPGDRPAA